MINVQVQDLLIIYRDVFLYFDLGSQKSKVSCLSMVANES